MSTFPSPSDLPLDPDRVRALFPAFAQDDLKGEAFFENAGGSFTCQPVLNLLDDYYRRTKVQPYGFYPASEQAGKRMDRAYERFAQAMGVDADWIHFGPSTSINTYVLSRAFETFLTPGDVIIVTDQDHEANAGNWHRLARNGIQVRVWTIDPETGSLDPAMLENLLDEKVRLVAFPHCSNIVGEINPAAEWCRTIQKAGALAVVDGVSYAPHGLPDLAEISPDIYLFSTYKTFGPHLGVMAIRPELGRSLPNQGHYFNDDRLRYRLTPAGPDHAQIAAAAGVIDYLEQVARMAPASLGGATPFHTAHAAMRAQETALLQPLLDWLTARNDIRLIGPAQASRRAPTVSIALEKNAARTARDLTSRHIMAGGGHFYSVRTLKGLGIDPAHGVLRLSFVHYTSPGEMARLVDALSAVL